jgi:hypothetical protein
VLRAAIATPEKSRTATKATHNIHDFLIDSPLSVVGIGGKNDVLLFNANKRSESRESTSMRVPTSIWVFQRPEIFHAYYF